MFNLIVQMCQNGLDLGFGNSVTGGMSEVQDEAWGKIYQGRRNNDGPLAIKCQPTGFNAWTTIVYDPMHGRRPMTWCRKWAHSTITFQVTHSTMDKEGECAAH